MGHPTRSGQDPILSRLELLARMMARSWAELPTKSPRTTLRTSTQNRYLHDTANTAYVESLSISCRETSQGLHLVMKAGLWIRSPNVDLVDGARTDGAIVPQLAAGAQLLSAIVTPCDQQCGVHSCVDTPNEVAMGRGMSCSRAYSAGQTEPDLKNRRRG